MPLMDVIYPEGALRPDAREELLQTLWAICLRWEGVPETDATASIAWVYLDERPRDRISVGGGPLSQNIYRAHVRVMAGFMDQERTDGMVREVTEAIAQADGTAGDGTGPRVYCLVEEVPSGTWGVDGTVWDSVFTARAVDADPRRVEAMQRAIAATPRALVPLSATSSR
jgi:phenylpyruvate tautomerase PptA (4-oxalocrotonate tautomerase family)